MPAVQTEQLPFFASASTFDAVVQQWAKARIDVPMQVIARFDDAAKQLITIASTWQALYVAVFNFGTVKEHVPLPWLGIISAPLVLLLYFAAQAICTMPLRKEAFDTYQLFKTRPGLSDEQLTGAIDHWCQTVDEIADKKHRWLQLAKIVLVLNSAVSVTFVIALMR